MVDTVSPRATIRGITLVSSVVLPEPLQPAKPMMRMGHHSRLYVPSLGEATHPRCDHEGYPDWPGRASSKEGES